MSSAVGGASQRARTPLVSSRSRFLSSSGGPFRTEPLPLTVIEEQTRITLGNLAAVA